MNIHELFKRRVFISRVARQDRRDTLLVRLAAIGINDAIWFPAIEHELFKSDTRGFVSLAKRSCAVGKRLILREAGFCNAPSLLFLEDDVIFHPNFAAQVKFLQLPKDWGLFYFGCQHIEAPEWRSPGVVRVSRALDMHAVAIRSEYYLRVRAAMRGGGKGKKGGSYSDYSLSALHKSIPTYAAYPNLAWQAADYSDDTGKFHSHYLEDGTQKWNRQKLAHLDPTPSHPIYRLQCEQNRSVKAAESLRGLFVRNVSMARSENESNDISYHESLFNAQAHAFRHFLTTSASHAIIIEDNVILHDKKWLCLRKFDYFQPLANDMYGSLKDHFINRHDIHDRRPVACIVSRRFAKACLRLHEVGTCFKRISLLASKGLPVGNDECDGVTLDRDAPPFRFGKLTSPTMTIKSHEIVSSDSARGTPNRNVRSVSFCTFCKDHRHHLQVTLPKNLANIRQRDAEIVLLDWHSEDGLAEWVFSNYGAAISSGILKFYQLQENCPFSIPIAKNFVHRCATGKIIVNLDADNYIDDLWYGAQLLEENSILVCEKSGHGTLGRIGLSRENLERTGGYDESLEVAGYCERDLIKRGVGLGLKKRNWPCDKRPFHHGKMKSLEFAQVGGEMEWRAMNRRNALRSQGNLENGHFRANGLKLAGATFLRNFKELARATTTAYFLEPDGG
jgi:hypothetical protein